jgi:hypothetical protein
MLSKNADGPAVLLMLAQCFAACATPGTNDALRRRASALAQKVLAAAIRNRFRDPVAIRTDPDFSELLAESAFKNLGCRRALNTRLEASFPPPGQPPHLPATEYEIMRHTHVGQEQDDQSPGPPPRPRPAQYQVNRDTHERHEQEYQYPGKSISRRPPRPEKIGDEYQCEQKPAASEKLRHEQGIPETQPVMREDAVPEDCQRYRAGKEQSGYDCGDVDRRPSTPDARAARCL